MLLTSVVVVLREVLEAALLMSVFLALLGFLNLGVRSVGVGIILGMAGAVAYGYMLAPISDLLDGVGQEVFNAAIHYLLFAILGVIFFFTSRRLVSPPSHAVTLSVLIGAAIALAIIREGAEILVFISGFWSSDELFSAVGIGALIGAGIGFSVGAMIYFILVAQPVRRALPIAMALLLLIGAGMSSQATRLLIQADWISAGSALWDTSGILAEDSLSGQLLYALVGYEASPSGVEVAAYVAAILFLVAAFSAGRVARPVPVGT
jgi:high-affinity iron transporter